MKIAILGTRGIPANYGGFETFAEEVSVRLVEAGHEVIVYGRRAYYSKRQRGTQYRGVRTVYLPALRKRELETLSHTFVSFWHMVLKNRPQAVVLCNIANGYIIPWLRLWGIKVLINVDGMEWRRRKWNRLGRAFYRACVNITVISARRGLVADSRAIARFYKDHFRCDPIYISYGAPVLTQKDTPDAHQILRKLGIESGGYILQITRMVPENNTHRLVEAFQRMDTDKKLFLVGGDTHDTAYIRAVHDAAAKDKRILLPGRIYDKQVVNTLLVHGLAYFHGNEVGGTNPALLQAMGAGGVVLAVDTVYNREVLQDAGFYFDKQPGSVAVQLEHILGMDSETRWEVGERARLRIARHYNWDDVARRYSAALEQDVP